MTAEMFSFDAGDSHFFSHNLKELVTPPTPTSFLDDARVESNDGPKNGRLASGMNDTGSRKAHSRSLDEHPTEIILSGTGTPPIPISMTPAEARSRSQTRAENMNEMTKDLMPRPLPQAGKAGRRKKKGPKKGAVAALSTVRGFTPATSGDEDSDWSNDGSRSRRELSTHRKNVVLRKDFSLERSGAPSAAGIQDFRSSSPGPGLSALSQQLGALDCDLPGRSSIPRHKSKLSSGDATSASVTSGTSGDEEVTEMTSYEVPLEHDFISPDVSGKGKRDGRQDSLFNGGMVRKMHATDFDPLRCLGKGTYGTVLLVKQQCTGKLYAQKQFRKASLNVRKQLVEQTKTERSILESINRHPFVVKLYYAFQDHEKLYLILEYAQGGELFERLRHENMLPEETAAFYMAELALALEHLHLNVGVVYRDLKPENCLLDSEGHLLLTDFGLSKVAVDGEHKCRSMTGTFEYMAPEVIESKVYGTAVDWWSFGILGYEFLTGGTPFRANNDTKIAEKILKAKPVLPYYLSLDAKDLLNRLLRKEPKKRLGANMPKDMQTIKKHRFFRKIDWNELERREVEPPFKPLITDPELAENFSNEFTNLSVSPVSQQHPWAEAKGEHDAFGGFSFVGSKSLLESDGFF